MSQAVAAFKEQKQIQFKTENYTTFSVVDDETSRCVSVSVCQNFGQSETRLILERDQAKSKALKNRTSN